MLHGANVVPVIGNAGPTLIGDSLDKQALARATTANRESRYMMAFLRPA
jgi:hypothetical protein